MVVMKTQDFFEQFNQATLDGNIAFIAQCVAEDFVWITGSEGAIRGKAAFVEFLEKMQPETKPETSLTVDNIIASGLQAAVTGKMTGKKESGETKTYMYCDVYKFDEQQPDKIKELTNYVVELKK